MAGYNISIDDAKLRKKGKVYPLRQPNEAKVQMERLLRNEKCWYCGCATQKLWHKDPNFHTRDHVIPKSKGGGGGTVPACKWCNSRKGSLIVEEFRAKFSMLKNLPLEQTRFYGETLNLSPAQPDPSR